MTVFGVYGCRVGLSRRAGRWNSGLLDLSQPQNCRRGKYFRLGFRFRTIGTVCRLPLMTISGLCDCRAWIVLPTTAVNGCFSRSPASHGGAALGVARCPAVRTAEGDLAPTPRMQWIGPAWLCWSTRKPQRLARRYLVPSLRDSLCAPLGCYPGLCRAGMPLSEHAQIPGAARHPTSPEPSTA